MPVSNVAWRKSTRSGPWTDNCVEVALTDGAILVRDSKDPAGPVLTFSAKAWREFLAGIREDQFERER